MPIRRVPLSIRNAQRFVVLAVAILFAGCGSENNIAALDTNDIEPAIFSVTTVSCSEDQTRTAIAFAIDDSMLVTVAHSFAEARSFQVVDHDGETRQASLVALDEVKDIALLDLEDDADETLFLSQDRSGESVSFARFEGSAISLQEASLLRQVAISIDESPRRAMLELDASVQQGDSGSPVLNADGEAVGMVFGVSKEEPTKSWALASEEIMAAATATPHKTARLACNDSRSL